MLNSWTKASPCLEDYRYRIARNSCAPKILRIAVKRPSADNKLFLRIKLSTVKLGVVNKHLRIIFLRLLIHSQNFWAAEISSNTVC